MTPKYLACMINVIVMSINQKRNREIAVSFEIKCPPKNKLTF